MPDLLPHFMNASTLKQRFIPALRLFSNIFIIPRKEKKMKQFNTKALAQAAMLLAICILSQFFKNLSVYITGPVINACLIICAATVGLGWAIMLSVVTPVTSYIITGSPIMSAIPLIIPCVMIGNVILAVCVALLKNKPNTKIGTVLSMLTGSVAKACFMGGVISVIIIPALLPEKLTPNMKVFQMTFSLTQLITALIGSAFAYVIMIAIKAAMKHDGQ